jgi:hypothetical protein
LVAFHPSVRVQGFVELASKIGVTISRIGIVFAAKDGDVLPCHTSTLYQRPCEEPEGVAKHVARRQGRFWRFTTSSLSPLGVVMC